MAMTDADAVVAGISPHLAFDMHIYFLRSAFWHQLVGFLAAYDSIGVLEESAYIQWNE